MILVKMQMDTNDADYVYGFRVFEDADWENIKRLTKKLFDKQEEVWVNILNQDVLLSSYEDWLGSYEWVTITDDEFTVLKKCFAEKYRPDKVEFGYFELPHEYADIEDDDTD